MTGSDRDRLPAARYLRVSGEAVLLILATLSAWPFGCAGTFWEYVATATVAVLAGLWTAHAVVTRRFRFRHDLVSNCLAGLILLSAIQLVPLPLPVVRVISPARAELHTSLVPDPLERLPDETAAEPRPTFIPLSVDPFATRTFAAQVVCVFVVYAAARSWLGSKAAFRRLAWVALANGVALAALALAQFFSPVRHLMYWTFDHGVVGYGPFVCRNHYPDFLALCIGLAVGLMLTPDDRQEKAKKKQQPSDATEPASGWDQLLDLVTAPIQLLERPVPLAAALAVGFMLVSIPFSLSRGGLLAAIGGVVFTWVLARWRNKAAVGAAGWAITAVVAVVAAVLIWKGTAPIQQRFESTFSGTAVDDRTPIWVAAGKQVPGFWLAGSGNGSFLRVEPLGRTDESPGTVYDHAHNEFVEAAIEGGVIRLGLTLTLVGGVLIRVAGGYRKLRERSVGGLLLGAWFGLLVLTLHAVTDFAIHVPAVALFAAVVAGYAVGMSSDVDYKLVRRKSSRTAAAPEPAGPPPPAGATNGAAAKLPPWLIPTLLTLTAVFAALHARMRYRAERYWVAGELVRSTDRFDQRIEYLTGKTRVSPADPAGWFELAQAHFDAAVARRTADGFPPAAVTGHVVPGLRAVRTARNLCPLYPEVHARLGLYADHFAEADLPLAYWERAKRLLPSDPEVWYACGLEAMRAGNVSAAAANWRRSLELSPKALKGIVRSAVGIPPAELRERVLPDDPAVMAAAADVLFPDRVGQRNERRPFLEKALAAAGRPELTLPQLNAVTAAGDELGQPQAVTDMWVAAVRADPNDRATRLAAAGWYEREELYDLATAELEWLVRQTPADRSLTDRLRAARHGQKLQQILGR